MSFRLCLQFCLCILNTYIPVELAYAKGSDWRIVEGSSFVLLSDANDRVTNRILEDLHYFQEGMKLYLGNASSVTDPRFHHIIVASKQKNFKLLAGKAAENVAGMYLNTEFNPTIIIKATHDPTSRSEIVYHEYSHKLFEPAVGQIAPWASEGLAEVFATFHRNKKLVYFGHLKNDRRILHFDARDMFTLDDFFAISRNALIEKSNKNRRFGHQFYAQAKTLAHMCIFGLKDNNPEGYFNLCSISLDRNVTEEDVKRELGMDFKQLKRKLYKYLDGGGRYQYTKIPIDDLAPPPNYLSRDATTSEKSVIIAKALYGLGKFDEADDFVADIQIEEYSDFHYFEALSIGESVRKDYEEAGGFALKALVKGSRDPFIYALSVRHAIDGGIERYDIALQKNIEEMKELLYTARSLGGSSVLQYELMYSLSVKSKTTPSLDDQLYLQEGEILYPEISYNGKLPMLLGMDFKTN